MNFLKGILATLLAMMWLGLPLCAQPFPPSQPSTGPGGSNYAHASVSSTVHGLAENQYTIFEPQSPHPATAPLIVFHHGYNALTTDAYLAWITHLTRRGNVVVYPRYQSDATSPPTEFITNSINAVKSAITRLQTEAGRTRPQLDKFATVGHSVGGLLSANMAALAEASGLPKPLAVMCATPGKAWGPPALVIPLANLANIRPGTLLLALAGEEDDFVFDTDARRIFQESVRIAPDDKDYVVLKSDYHGLPAMVANHVAPCASTNSNFTPDAHDFFGLWKLFDGLTDAAFYGTNRHYALGGTAEQRFTGRWSDGQPVVELAVAPKPPALTVLKEGASVVISWPTALSNFVLQTAADSSTAGTNWQVFTNFFPPVGGMNVRTQAIATNTAFFRLWPK